MGALTDTRKRCYVDLSFPSFPISFDQTPLSKKPKLPPPQTLENPLLPPPFRRRVQGPQRTIRVFGLGSTTPETPEPEREGEMGGFLSRVAKKARFRYAFGSGKGKEVVGEAEDGNLDGGLDLDEYKKLVEVAKDGNLRDLDGSGRFVFPRTPAEAVCDLRDLAREEERTPETTVLNRKVEGERRVEVELAPGSDEVRWTKRTTTPVYKDLLEETSRKYDHKLSSLEFEVKLAEERISQFHLLQEEESQEKLEPFIPLTDEEENDVKFALQSPNRSLRPHDILVTHKASNIEITREVIQCLKRGAWLNDEVINLYLELLKEREKREPKKFLKCHFFNTFFYKKLTSGKGHYDFKAVRRWTTQRKIGYGLIECDKIFVPIHKEIHWCLAVIDVKYQKLLYLDSLGGMDCDVLTVLARYLTDEAKDKSNKVLDVSSWEQESVDDLPLQQNGWDCGMFMLKYADFYSRGLGLNFGQANMNYFRRRTVKELLNLRAE